MGKKKIKWNNGDVFAIKLENSKFAVGQILDLQMENVVRCALFNSVFDNIEDPIVENAIQMDHLISLVATTREQLDFNEWVIIGNSSIEISKTEYPNEEFRNNGWIGAQVYDAGIIEEFISAFHGLVPWDDWADPKFLDALLIDQQKKPANLKYKNSDSN